MSKTVVVASGYFNPLHYGHVSYLQKAKDCGTHLIVIVNNDKQTALKFADQLGHISQCMAARDRVRLVRSLACVDAAIESVDEDESVAESLRMLHPDVFANGGKSVATLKESAACKDLGIKMMDGLGIQMLILQPFTQHYEWGKHRARSAVAYLAGESGPSDRESPSSRPFAELWMGDHPSGPSKVRSPGGDLKGCLITTLKRSPGVLGSKLSQEGGVLPFLMKVLSIEKALSIQAHPDRALAARLHKERPEVYKDPNHKPEIAIALTDFEAMCGFRPISELVEFLDAVPELAELVGEAAMAALRDVESTCCEKKERSALKMAYSNVMRTSQVVIDRLVPVMVERISSTGTNAFSMDFAAPDVSVNLQKAHMLVIRLHRQFGEDIGIFSVFFLNYVEMTVGGCLYMPQNTPHAYLSGDIVECMSCSDNVVRGGLTPKFKDIEVLCDMLVYKGGVPPSIAPEIIEEGVCLYSHPDLDEFQVTHISMASGKSKRFTFSAQGPAVGFCFRGGGQLKISEELTKLTPGVVFLLAAGVDCHISAASDLQCFVACCPPKYFSPPSRRGSESSNS